MPESGGGQGMHEIHCGESEDLCVMELPSWMGKSGVMDDVAGSYTMVDTCATH